MKPSPSPISPDQIGKSVRSTDTIEEDLDNPLSTENDKVFDLLSWHLDPHRHEREESPSLRTAFGYGMKFNKFEALEALKEAKLHGVILDRLADVTKDLFYAGRDLVGSNKVKTSLTMIGSIGLGTAIGGVIGSVIPIAGTAIGGAIGGTIGAGIASAVAGGAAVFGGALGFGILGAFGGSWAGKKISGKIFKPEKRFELSKRVTNRINRMAISSDLASKMNAYLYNRRKSVKSPLCKEEYKEIRRKAIFEGNPTAMENVARFFCQELRSFEKEIKKKPADEGLRIDQEAVVGILKELQNAKLFSGIKREINFALRNYEEHRVASLPKIKKEGLFVTEKKIPPKALHEAKNKFVEIERKFGIEVEAHPTKGHKKKEVISYHYDVRTAKGVPLPAMDFNGESVTVDASQLTDKNKNKTALLLVTQAKSAGMHEVEVKSGGQNPKTRKVNLAKRDLVFAKCLMVAAIRAGLNPTLNEAEYPEGDPAREKLLKEVAALTKPKQKYRNL